ncbi:hypothetical protein NPIL_343491, partial [Nephila pilipes]
TRIYLLGPRQRIGPKANACMFCTQMQGGRKRLSFIKNEVVHSFTRHHPSRRIGHIRAYNAVAIVTMFLRIIQKSISDAGKQARDVAFVPIETIHLQRGIQWATQNVCLDKVGKGVVMQNNLIMEPVPIHWNHDERGEW